MICSLHSLPSSWKPPELGSAQLITEQFDHRFPVPAEGRALLLRCFFILLTKQNKTWEVAAGKLRGVDRSRGRGWQVHGLCLLVRWKRGSAASCWASEHPDIPFCL